MAPTFDYTIDGNLSIQLTLDKGLGAENFERFRNDAEALIKMFAYNLAGNLQMGELTPVLLQHTALKLREASEYGAAVARDEMCL